MQRGFLIFILALFLGCYIAAVAFSKTSDDEICYINFSKKELLNDLSFSEKQIFNNTYKSDDITSRLERLEIAVFGAIQSGEEDFRIKKIRKSVTNISSGGNGLNNLMRTMNLGGEGWGTNNLWVGNMHTFTPNYYNNSRRLHPPRGIHSHRIPPPPNAYSYNSNPITTGDFMRNYTIGTSVKILDD